MLVVVSYDVSTKDTAGGRRLRQVAQTCVSCGQRVQNSVFECLVDNAQWTKLKLRLLQLFDPATDSLRFYHLGSNFKHRVEHHGAKATVDLRGPLLI